MYQGNDFAGPGPAGGAPPATPDLLPRIAGACRLLEGAWARRLLPEPTLDPDELVAAATAAMRSDDFGGDHWIEPFGVLAGALAGEARLNAVGRTFAHVQLGKLLRQRLATQRLWRAHPEIAEVPIVAPIIVLGSMRSGTTRVQRLLAADPRLAHTRLHEAQYPLPGRLDGRLGRRLGRRLGSLGNVAATAAAVALLRGLNPALPAVHPTGARRPDEEFGLLGPSFHGAQFDAQWQVPSLVRFWQQADAARTLAMYREFRRLMQTLAWRRGGEPRPWVMKAPDFLDGLDALLTVFPDARLVCLTRDAPAVVASSASLVWQQQRVQSDAACRHAIGRFWLDRTARRLEVAGRVLAQHAAPRITLDYAAIDADWRGEMARLYRFLDMPLTPGVVVRMAGTLRGGVHHGHRYRLADFGLTPADVRARLPNGA